MSYDPHERRDTPLALKLKERIRSGGAITVADYMQACLYDPKHGYYSSRVAIGAGGDFITAPEISQIFGELIGLWAVVVWQQMGSPRQFNLIELGPGRSVLIRDALRAARSVPAFIDAAAVHLLEWNTTLETTQRALLSSLPRQPVWHREIASLPSGPAILIGNEFLDTFPVTQIENIGGRLSRRGVGLDGRGELMFTTLEDAGDIHIQHDIAPGEVLEVHDLGLFDALLDRMAHQPFAGLLIDYGHMEPAAGETLQAVRNHRAEHPLCSPGEADLTTHVDFSSVRGAAEDGPDITCDGPITQAEFLGRLGIVERASRLMSANPGKAAEIEAGVARLMAPNGMGTRFKVLGIRRANLPLLPGF